MPTDDSPPWLQLLLMAAPVQGSPLTLTLRAALEVGSHEPPHIAAGLQG